MQFDTSRPIDLTEKFIESVDFSYIESEAATLARFNSTNTTSFLYFL